MPVLEKDTTPKAIRPFTKSHGLDLTPKSGGQYEGECPLCGKHRFRVNDETGQWDCKTCDVSGNLYSFLRWLWTIGDKGEVRAGQEDVEAFKTSRTLTSTETLREWGIVRSPITSEWLVPGYDQRGEIMNLYVYRPPYPGAKPTLQSTYNCEHQLFGSQLFDRRKSRAIICESLWDALVLWEILPYVKESEKGVTYTKSRNLSIAPQTNVVAVPGANVFKDQWREMFTGKQVTLLFHSDHPKPKQDGTFTVPSGHGGLRGIVKALTTYEQPPASIDYLFWGEQGYDPELPSGYDLRDWLTNDTDGE